VRSSWGIGDYLASNATRSVVLITVGSECFADIFKQPVEPVAVRWDLSEWTCFQNGHNVQDRETDECTSQTADSASDLLNGITSTFEACKPHDSETNNK
jgi:hypothetical protein